MVACKELTNFHWRFPDRKRSPSFRNHPSWSSWKPSLLALRVSPSVYEGVSGILVCGPKVAAPIRSLFCNAALFASWSAAWPLCTTSVLPFWCPLQWETETSVGRWTASKSLRIWSPYLIGDPGVVKWPLSFQIAACAYNTRKAYLESVEMTTLYPFPSSKAWVRAMSSANFVEVPCGKGLSSMVSKLRLLHLWLFFFHPRQSFFHQCTRFPQDWSEDLLTIRLEALSSGPRFLGKSERGESPRGSARRVAGLRTSQADIVRPGLSISITWYLRIL